MFASDKQNLIELIGNPDQCLMRVNLSSSTACNNVPSSIMHAEESG
jgi:hypothetical protein